ncbi:hypothetical protein HYT56_04990 [Candidatus Woesearchaeota archaeon]|nr:hypothetical protein [Candidatus Woesearchaeota archaeon]
MIIIKDSMVIIHLAKLSILEKSCKCFEKVMIPELVHKEIIKEKDRTEITIINELIKNNEITIKKINDQNLIKKANQFNIQKGEAEVVGLYWQEKANLIATDDDNVRKKKIMLNIKIIGTPAIILGLYQKKIIDKNKTEQCISELKKIGWFANTVLDKIQMEVEK